MGRLSTTLKHIFTDVNLRRRILVLIGALALFRVFAAIPVPGVDVFALEQFFARNQFFGLLNIFTGGGLSNLSVVMLGVGPYITATIVMQLLTVMVPKLKSMYHEEGQAGRMRFTQYSRLLTVPLAAVQGFGFLTLLKQQGVLLELAGFDLITNIIIITAGAILAMWLGELMTEFGIGNGVSLLILAGIVASVPSSVAQLIFTYDASLLPQYLGFALAALAIVYAIVVMTEAERPIPITYAKTVRGMHRYGNVDTYLPIRVNQAGVMPIIFGLSIVLFPQMIINLFAGSSGGFIGWLTNAFEFLLNNTLLYSLIYFALVFFFTYFYTAITFEPDSVASNLQRNGAFIPGIRPGQSTSAFISKVLSRVTFVGAVFLGLIAVLPLVMQQLTGIQTLTIGGTALLIVVAVFIDLIKRVDAQVTMREY